MQPLTLEYIAGFVDGEGTIAIGKHKKGTYRPIFSISNTDLQILKDIRKYFSITTKLSIKRHKKANWKPCYDLRVNGIDECKSIAMLLEPYLRIKKEQAQIIMQYPRANPMQVGAHTVKDFSTETLIQKLRNRISKLNKRGNPVQGANEDLQPEPDPQLNLLDLNQKEVI